MMILRRKTSNHDAGFRKETVMKIILSADDFGRSHEMNMAIDYAMRNHMVCSTALLMGSEFTEEAVGLAFAGGYIQNVHCHLNLAPCRRVGNHFIPLNDAYKKSRFCRDGEFASTKYYHADFMKYADIIYQELETQYLTFKELTRDRANALHLDFHLYKNLNLPVAAAYDRLIKDYHIQSARFFGEHQREAKESWKRKLVHAAMISHWRHSKAYVCKSSKIEYFLARKEHFEKDRIVELFVHPDYQDGVLIDQTNLVFGNELKPLEEHIALVRQCGDVEFISWASLNK